MSKEDILTYNNGSCYIGEVLNGKKHGKGVLSTCAFVYSAGTPVSSELAHLSKWNEYHGCLQLVNCMEPKFFPLRIRSAEPCAGRLR